MRFLGIDYGAKRVGVAISDEYGKMAFPYAVLKSDENLAREIKKICEKEKIKKIILGLPLDLKNRSTHNTKPVLEFEKKLENAVNPVRNSYVQNLSKSHSKKSVDVKISNGVKVPIILEKEFYTTKEAERTQGKIKNIDASAAALILKHYFDKIK